jgi:hypothetical protein
MDFYFTDRPLCPPQWQKKEKIMQCNKLAGADELKFGNYTFPAVGTCLECGGVVFDLKHEFACINSIIGKCSFHIGCFDLENAALIDAGDAIVTLLEDGVLITEFCPCDGTPNLECHTKLFKLKGYGWGIEEIREELI